VFDPFGDFATEGYLRNFDKEKDPEIVKIAEHELFRAQLPKALDFLAQKKRIEYSDPVTEKEYLEFERRRGYQLKEPNEN
jgi:hypothetical protein